MHRSTTRTFRLLGAFTAALSLGACFRHAIAPRELYRLRTMPSVVRTANDESYSAPLEQPLHVETYTTPGVYAEPQIVYRDDAARYGTYPNREWAIPLGTMLSALTMETLRQTPGYGADVQDGATAPRHGLAWQGTVRELEEVDRGGQVFAAVRLDARVVRAEDDSVLWLGSARAESRVTRSTDMTAVVDSLSSIATRVIASLARDARSSLARHATARTSLRGAPPR